MMTTNKVLFFIAAVLTTACVPGCSTAPTPTEVRDAYREARDVFMETYDQLRARCHADYPAGSEGLNTCLTAARQ